MGLRFTVLASGSRGNASLIQGGASAGVLLDLGLGPRDLRKRLTTIGADWDAIGAAILTHTHSDHWKDATLAQLRRRRIPFYCHAEHHAALLAYGEEFARMLADDLVVSFTAREEFSLAGGLRCRALPVRHDSGATFGFRFETGVGLFQTPAVLGYASDLGCWNPELAQALADVDVLAVEFNHDVDLQYASGRSPLLIRRVLSEHGHLSNAQAGALLAHVLTISTPGRLQHVVQLHLSQECNRPALAQEAAQAALGAQHVQVHTARQDRPLPTLDVGPTANGGSARPARAAGRRVPISQRPCLPGLEP